MFLRLFLCLLFVAALTEAAALLTDAHLARAACEKYTLPICTREYDPVCGSDGQSYANECMFCINNLQNHWEAYIVKKGSC